MGILEYVVRLRQRPRRLTIVFLGLSNAGKTTIIRVLGDELKAEATVPTQGFVLKKLNVNGVKCDVLDVGGTDSYWRQYFNEASGVVFVVDTSNVEALPTAADELELILEEEKLLRVPTLIFANKRDVSNVADEAVVTAALNLTAVKNRQWKVQECSAVTGDGLEEGMTWLLGQINGAK